MGIRTEKNEMVSELKTDDAFWVYIDYWLMIPQSRIWVNLVLYSTDGSPIFETVTSGTSNTNEIRMPRGLFRASCAIPANLLNDGGYRPRFIFCDSDLKKIFDYDYMHFIIHDTSQRGTDEYGKNVGYIKPKLDWITELIKLEE